MYSIEIDFQVIESNDPKVLLVWDTSRWSFIKNKPATITVTYEDETPTIEYFAKNRLNIIDSYRIFNQHGKELPDGLYTILVEGSPDIHNKERYYFSTSQIRRDIDLLYKEQNTKEEKNELIKLEQLLFTINALIRRTMPVEAKRVYKALKTMVEDISTYKECKNC